MLASLITAILLAALFLPGCVKVGPDYAEPKMDMPAAFSGQTRSAALNQADVKALETWWEGFGDPALSDLVRRALAGNLDLKQAKARVEKVRAQRRIAVGALYPAADASGSGKVTRARDEGLNWLDTERYGVGLDASWEADVFGGNRRAVEAAQADYDAAREDYRAVMVSLTAETAAAYVSLRTYQSRVATARENLRLQQETLDLTRIKHQTGMAGALDVEQASYNLESTRSQIPDLEAGVAEMKNRLAVLLGVWPDAVEAELSRTAPVPRGSLSSTVGIPADLIRRRPDIRAAERRLAAQTARIGEAESDLYPKLALTGSLGYESLVFSSLVSPASMLAALGAGISWPILNTEAIRGNIQVQTALQEEALLEYEATVRAAVEEVNNALTALAMEARKQQALAQAVSSAQEAAALALQGYENGISDFQSVLTTQQSLTSFKDKLDQSRGQSAQDLIVMYKSLGGGWSASQTGEAGQDQTAQAQP